MPTWIPDVVMVILILGMTYALMSEGLWGACLMFFDILFAGLIAFNFYEPLAGWLAGLSGSVAPYADSVSLMVLFIVALVILRITTEQIAPAMVRFPTPVYHIGRIFFAYAGASLAMSIFIIAYHNSPVHKKMFGSIDYDSRPPFGQGLDHRWLSFFQYASGQVFARYGSPYVDPFGEFSDARVFDPRGRWLIDHQNARPFGNDLVPPPPAEETPAEGEGAEGGGGGPGGGPPGMPGPGM